MTVSLTNYRLGQSLLFVAPASCFAINPWGNYDPISVVKMSVLSTISFLSLSLMISNGKKVFNKSTRLLQIFALTFLLLMTLTLFMSRAPLNQQIWGVFGRNTGFLTYFCLIVLVMAASSIRDFSFFSKFIFYLLFTGFGMSLYCLLQIAGKDPIGWSLFQTFGTLGNINFLSAFLGLVCIAALSLVISNQKKVSIRFLSLILLVVDLYIIRSTGSIQGIVMFLAGSATLFFIFLGKYKPAKPLRLIFSFIVIALSSIGILGLSNKGPLKYFLFQESNVLRTDYWHAGWAMTLNHPIFGVGMDSYGDWYRASRGQISTLRGSPDRTANTAHNIFLDISSNGGFIFLALYLAILLLALRSAVKIISRQSSSFDPIFSAMFSCWVAYQLQSLVSINQIGVGVWGWILTGALIGYEKTVNEFSTGSSKRVANDSSRAKSQLLPARISLFAILASALGFFSSFPALKADMDFFRFIKSNSLPQLQATSSTKGVTAWHMGRVIELSMRSNDQLLAKTLAVNLTKKFPRDYFGWYALLNLPNSTQEEKTQALEILRNLDPFNPQWK